MKSRCPGSKYIKNYYLPGYKLSFSWKPTRRQSTGVANIVKKKHEEGNEIIVVVSAMSGVTNDLIKKSQEVSDNFNVKELDVLLSSGEQASSALLAGTIIDLGINARSWLGWQIPIVTDSNHSSSQIQGIATDEIKKSDVAFSSNK